MYNEPDILESDSNQETELLERAQINLAGLTDEEFFAHYKVSKPQYTTLLTACNSLKSISVILEELGGLNIDSEIIDNTQYLIDDYISLLSQIHMTSFWESEQHS